ncbi:hypothetical protein M514_18646 [Trichuris suis]|uniref:Uncharacterized protein n=1 Tax=Trichuris suis TaxID=68888 RepID=A0A085NHX3_9BILA|nr:hypothetical protein M514_18646 [Trichuris suis]
MVQSQLAACMGFLPSSAQRTWLRTVPEYLHSSVLVGLVIEDNLRITVIGTVSEVVAVYLQCNSVASFSDTYYQVGK